ncbi:MAG TPA: PAS domain-containing protein [Geobacteraceae bacterium]|nr:PAS domain-containing protein [Geobacteraceae bacterium]
MDESENIIHGDNDSTFSVSLSREAPTNHFSRNSRKEPSPPAAVRNLENVNRIAGIAHGEYDAITGAIRWPSSVPYLPGLHNNSLPRSFAECLNLYTQLESEVLREALDRTLRNNEQIEAEVHCTMLPASRIRHRYTFIPLQQVKNTVTKVLCLVRDISGTRTLSSGTNWYPENSIPLSQDMRYVFFRISIPDGTCEYISRAVEAITGYPPRIWYRNPFLIKEIIHPAWQTKFEREFKKFLDTMVREEYTFPIRNHRDDVRWIQLRTSTIRNEHEELLAVEGIALDITEKKQEEMERKALIRQLQKALNEVKTLSGLLPICSYCKKVRDDKGYWKQIESYISEHSELFFTHGLCPECLAHHYPQYTHPHRQTKNLSKF